MTLCNWLLQFLQFLSRKSPFPSSLNRAGIGQVTHMRLLTQPRFTAIHCNLSAELSVISVTPRGQMRRFWGGKKTLIQALAMAFSKHGDIEVTGLRHVFLFISFFLLYLLLLPQTLQQPPTPPPTNTHAYTHHLKTTPAVANLLWNVKNLICQHASIISSITVRAGGRGQGPERRGGLSRREALIRASHWLELSQTA